MSESGLIYVRLRVRAWFQFFLKHSTSLEDRGGRRTARTSSNSTYVEFEEVLALHRPIRFGEMLQNILEKIETRPYEDLGV